MHQFTASCGTDLRLKGVKRGWYAVRCMLRSWLCQNRPNRYVVRVHHALQAVRNLIHCKHNQMLRSWCDAYWTRDVVDC